MKDKRNISCECAHFKFPDKIARRDVIYAYCAHPTAFNECFIKKTMDRFYYERKYAIESDEGIDQISCGR